jgi:arginase
MRPLELIGVPYTSMRESGGIADGIAVLRSAGLVERLTSVADVRDAGDLELEQPDGRRGPSGLLNEPALAGLFDATRGAVSTADDAGRLPLLVGGDCPVLLGPLAALRERGGKAALLMIDGHEDAWPPSRSPTGEASDSEVAIALGEVSSLPGELASAMPLLSPEAIAMLGPRDGGELRDADVLSLADRVGLLLDPRGLRERGVAVGIAEALAAVRDAAPRFWLHVDLDVLATREFPAADYLQPGGLHWSELREIVSTTLANARCAGATLAIYNPDLDPTRVVAAQVVEQLAVAVGAAADRAG